MTRRAPALLLVLLLAACGGGGGGDRAARPTPSSPAVQVLAAGKSDLDLAPGRYASPEGFAPRLELSLAGAWHSTHRGSDAFDLSRPVPGKDALRVAVVLVAMPDAAGAVRRARTRFPQAAPTSRQVGSRQAVGFVVTGAAGELLASPGGTLSLDAARGQRSELVAAGDLAVLVVVPDATQWPALQDEVAALLAGARIA